MLSNYELSELVVVVQAESANDDCALHLATLPAYIDGLREIIEFILAKQTEFNIAQIDIYEASSHGESDLPTVRVRSCVDLADMEAALKSIE